jgi:glycosyltransferase involved in cell wall biosynthesis
MRLLMLTNGLLYPPQSGGALRAYGILHSLRQANHEVALLSFDHAGSSTSRSILTDLCQSVHSVPPPTRSTSARLRHLLTSGQPDIVQRMDSEPLRSILVQLTQTQDFDAIQFEGLEMATYLPFVRALGLRARLIYDAFNAEFALQQVIASIDALTRSPRGLASALYSRIQAARIYAYERSICQLADAVIAVSDEDAALLQPLRDDRPLTVVPSGIFSASYSSTSPLDLGSAALVFSGKMDYRPNIDAVVWFVNDLLPRITSTVPQARFYIVGQQPTEAVNALAANPNVSVIGAVAEMPPYLSGASVYVAPLRMGSGTRLKLLEAMACGCAIVATSIAAAGLEGSARSTMCIRDESADFADAVTDLLTNADRRTRLGRDARRAVRDHYDWHVLMPRLLKVYEDIGLG